MNFMNVVFSAQKLGVIIDACILDNESVLLQQVVHTHTYRTYTATYPFSDIQLLLGPEIQNISRQSYDHLMIMPKL